MELTETKEPASPNDGRFCFGPRSLRVRTSEWPVAREEWEPERAQGAYASLRRLCVAETEPVVGMLVAQSGAIMRRLSENQSRQS